MATFKELGVSEALIKGLTELGIESPTEIQQLALPQLIKGKHDFIGKAQTGTGKTVAFGVPVLENIDPKLKQIQALILAPTRELCLQISKQLFKFTKFSTRIFTETVYGGEKIEKQISALRRPTHVVVATPGRLLDLIRRKEIDIRNVRMVILDEADEMLSMGFRADIDEILVQTKGQRNIWLFSATIPKGIEEIIHNYMSTDAFKADVSTKHIVNQDIIHQYAIVEPSQKPDALFYFLKSQKEGNGIVFCRTKTSAKTLADQMKARGFSMDVIHGDLLQKERDKVMRAFKGGKLQVLVATDISARGIDVADLAFVVHYELPDQIDYYTHRSGRTGRAGKRGLSLCLVAPKEAKKLKVYAEELGINFKKVE